MIKSEELTKLCLSSLGSVSLSAVHHNNVDEQHKAKPKVASQRNSSTVSQSISLLTIPPLTNCSVSNTMMEPSLENEARGDGDKGDAVTLVSGGSQRASISIAGATIAPSHVWSQPLGSSFSIRGPCYLKHKRKIPSQENLFPTRGVDMFLTREFGYSHVARYVRR